MVPELPGQDLIEMGLKALAAEEESIESLLVSIAAPRLRDLGLPVTRPISDPETKLYRLLRRNDPNGVHTRYNALVRRIDRYVRAAECVK